MTHVKICGLSTLEALEASVVHGARYVGFVFYPPSPRHISFETAAALASQCLEGVCKVALTVNATDAELEALIEAVPLDMLQLHGKESPERVLAVRERYGLPVMKAVGLKTKEDLPQIQLYGRVADQLLIDAKPTSHELPGGNGLAFDWNLLTGMRFPVPWMLAGGLTPENVASAIQLTGATQIDVSSGVEATKGVKSAQKIEAFLKAAQTPPAPNLRSL